MKITPKPVKIRDLVKDYKEDRDTSKVTAYGGRLNVRPAYQREFVYDEKKRAKVIDSIRHHRPINVMYWNKISDDEWEVIDGQQRTISICQYAISKFSIDELYIHNLTYAERDEFLNYELLIYECEGTDKERLEWFETINTAGEPLTNQELRNAVYVGPWLAAAKVAFSKRQCAAQSLSKGYVDARADRQELLERAIQWKISEESYKAEKKAKENDEPIPKALSIAEYMGKHQNDSDAQPLWSHFREVIEWVKIKFPTYRSQMKSVPWDKLWNEFHEREDLSAEVLEKEVASLMEDSDVKRKSGIYEYVLFHDTKVLNLRTFDENTRREAYERQSGHCPECQKEHKVDENGNDIVYAIEDMDADHITPWIEGGKTTPDNCQMLCKYHNRHKGKR